jgi:hypothetical protein
VADFIRFRKTAILHTFEVTCLAGSAGRDAAPNLMLKLAELIEKGGCCGF